MDKIEALECKMNKMMSEKDAVISSFQKLINQQQQTPENLEKKVKNLEEEVKIEEKCFKCHLCDFKSEFEKGLKTHINRKHKTENKKEESRKFPRVCEFCEKEIKSSKELKTHMKNHTYRYYIISVMSVHLWLRILLI